MGYSYSAPSTTVAHTHSGTAGDGGSLNMSTLILNAPLFAVLS